MATPTDAEIAEVVRMLITAHISEDGVELVGISVMDTLLESAEAAGATIGVLVAWVGNLLGTIAAEWECSPEEAWVILLEVGRERGLPGC